MSHAANATGQTCGHRGHGPSRGSPNSCFAAGPVRTVADNRGERLSGGAVSSFAAPYLPSTEPMLMRYEAANNCATISIVKAQAWESESHRERT